MSAVITVEDHALQFKKLVMIQLLHKMNFYLRFCVYQPILGNALVSIIWGPFNALLITKLDVGCTSLGRFSGVLLKIRQNGVPINSM